MTMVPKASHQIEPHRHYAMPKLMLQHDAKSIVQAATLGWVCQSTCGSTPLLQCDEQSMNTAAAGTVPTDLMKPPSRGVLMSTVRGAAAVSPGERAHDTNTVDISAEHRHAACATI